MVTNEADLIVAGLFFRQAGWLALLLPWLAGLLLWLGYRHKQLHDYSDASLTPWSLAAGAPARLWPWRWPLGFWLGVLLIVAVAGPRWALDAPATPQQTGGITHLVLLDASRSMTALDRQPDRFGHAQNLLAAWAQRLPAEDRVGLMLFGTEAYWALPITEDKALLQSRLGLLQAQRLPFAGTQLAVAMKQALAVAQEQGVQQVVLVTDGVLSEQQAGLLAVAEAYAQAKIGLLVVGVGSTDAVGLPDSASPTGWLVYDGVRVTVPMARQSLQRLAQAAQGRYVDDRNQSAALQSWFDYEARFLANAGLGLDDEKSADDTSAMQHAFYDLTPWVVGLLLLGLLWRYSTPSQQSGQQQAISSSPLALWLVAGLLVSLLSMNNAQAQQADYVRWMQAGEELHREQQHQQAQGYFRQALLTARNHDERARSLYNLGLSYADQQAWSLAVEAFEGALIHQADFPEAAHNLALAQRQHALELAAQARQAEQGEQTREQGENSEGVGRDGNEDPTLAGATDGENWGRDDDEDYWGEELPERDAQQAELPPEQQSTFASRGAWQGQAVIEQQRLDLAREQRQADLARYLDTIADDQVGILFHLFEREAGFQARQVEPRELPGVKPW
ncbi:VWA domain-containing protein [Thiomicrospira sp. ALE5]|uniref:vWA domain-containing protein n=1 Tax=Thiomicrospira sp. ALE5 TaxID=748650 RepID=UPI0008EAB351|nr:VWA domain-containing protein [Thiomicrospira sp. ALE5]SFR52749.1 Ca-activated chloride channel family protein [Thiomicrospira sp. ALE5]